MSKLFGVLTQNEKFVVYTWPNYNGCVKLSYLQHWPRGKAPTSRGYYPRLQLIPPPPFGGPPFLAIKIDHTPKKISEMTILGILQWGGAPPSFAVILGRGHRARPRAAGGRQGALRRGRGRRARRCVQILCRIAIPFGVTGRSTYR